ncbi:MAG: UDP-N-acetylmuramoyl-L-alanine--D-glutamate ligase [Magnetococcales bacterium]|nr:UDP-N-acetylmuramoyl-L-alanine--D-glutamate ligase [Magnetococcales bacterium]
MHPDKMTNKKVAIWGMGQEGRSVFARLKNNPLEELLCVDDSCSGHNMISTEQMKDKIEKGNLDVIIKSPGISLYDPIIDLARKRGVQVTSMTNMWIEEHGQAKVVAVTGTKGKSTTAKLIHFLLKKAGIDAALGGNVGIPLYDLNPGHALYIIEMSSYQLADFAGYVDVVVFLDLFPEHAVWHRTHAQYYQDKTSLLARARKAVIISGAVLKEYGHLINAGVQVTCHDAMEGFHVRDNDLYCGNTRVTPAHSTLKGRHNLRNLAAACSALSVLGVDPTGYLDGMAEFVPLPHRLQEVAELDGVLFVDDTLSTIPQSTVQAVAIYYPRTMSLILGGTDRRQDYAWLATALMPYQDRIKSIHAIPDNGERIIREFRAAHYAGEMSFVPDLETAVKASRASLTEGGVVLFSPAAPRGQRFGNSDARGMLFAQVATMQPANQPTKTG